MQEEGGWRKEAGCKFWLTEVTGELADQRVFVRSLLSPGNAVMRLGQRAERLRGHAGDAYILEPAAQLPRQAARQPGLVINRRDHGFCPAHCGNLGEQLGDTLVFAK